jgi:calcineurin-like phosphoesterase family protein
MPNIFLIGDTHFSQQSICEFLNADGSKVRPWDTAAEMDEAMIDRWNAVVKPGDKVYHFGDVTSTRKGIATMAKLNGRKVLIRGNHDIFKLGNLVLSHVPIHPDAITNRWCNGNVHGHLHGKLVMADGFPDPRYVNICVERIYYTPATLEDVLRMVRHPEIT